MAWHGIILQPATNPESAAAPSGIPEVCGESTWEFQGGIQHLGKPFGPLENFARHLEYTESSRTCDIVVQATTQKTERITRRHTPPRGVRPFRVYELPTRSRVHWHVHKSSLQKKVSYKKLRSSSKTPVSVTGHISVFQYGPVEKDK